MATAVKQRVPPLVEGDHLDRAEFLRRWEADPKIKHAELIGGIVYMPSPVSPEHGLMDFDAAGWLAVYRSTTPGVRGVSNTTTLLMGDVPQPDIGLRLLPEYGGASIDRKYLEGAPELIVEICRSSTAYDLHDKLELYQQAKIPEYLAVLLKEQEVRWHALTRKKYRLLKPDADGLLRSRIFPGLWLDPKALLAADMPTVLARLREGMESAEYRQFVAKLIARKSPPKRRKGKQDRNGR